MGVALTLEEMATLAPEGEAPLRALGSACERGWTTEREAQVLMARVEKGRAAVAAEPGRWERHLAVLERQCCEAEQRAAEALRDYWRLRCAVLGIEEPL